MFWIVSFTVGPDSYRCFAKAKERVKVRIQGIDAIEFVYKKFPSEFGKRAKQMLENPENLYRSEDFVSITIETI